MFKKPFSFLLLDLIIVAFSFLCMIWIKPVSTAGYIMNYLIPFVIFVSIWLASSIFMHKYRGIQVKNLKGSGWAIISSNFIAISLSAIVIYAVRVDFFSRQVVFGTVALASFIELLSAYIFYNVVHATEEFEAYKDALKVKDFIKQQTLQKPLQHFTPRDKNDEKIEKYLIESCGAEVYRILTENINPFYDRTLILSTITKFNVDKQPENYYENIINIKNINDIRFINKFFGSVNSKLPFAGMFIGCAETKNMRKKRLLNKYPLLINYFIYLFDFIFNRLLPKFQVTKGIYYFITKGLNRVLTKAEILGRLYYCGFELVREVETRDKYFFVVHKLCSPHKLKHSKYGLFIKLRRIGKNKKRIIVYKLRTMHPYSEYIQELVYSRHGTADGDKAVNDFRITNMGKVFRRLWLDELPMIYNLLKGEMKLVGVRPLSEAKFKMYPKHMQEKRTRSKPGLIPPFYVDLPKSFEELVASEEKYLDLYFQHPFRTDFKYFFKALFQIIIKKARSG
ncbi:MAG: sugar transferase [Bacteroidales bacterium]|nr:sugar transferase [Bacteroidales bacterium]MBN2820378.1 sugar transferase [Bacteroidales bacterium]